MVIGVSYSDIAKTHCHFSDGVYAVMDNKSWNMAEIKHSLDKPESEDEVIADLFILNQKIDETDDKKAFWSLYPLLSRYNQSNNPDIQTLLAGVYRKIKVPDAFGPLVAMLIRNAISPHQNLSFDPNEEIGGAILDYLA